MQYRWLMVVPIETGVRCGDMNGRTIVGAASLLVGLVVIAATVVYLGDDSRGAAAYRGTAVPGTPGPTAAASKPSASATASARPTAAASESRPPSSPDPFTRVSAFYSLLIPAIRDADADTLMSVLHPATIARYGLAACQAQLGSLDDPTYDVIVHGVLSPAAWDYTTDGLTTPIPDAIAVSASVTANGATETRELHVAMVDGEVRWFTDCGTPIVRAAPTDSGEPSGSPAG